MSPWGPAWDNGPSTSPSGCSSARAKKRRRGADAQARTKASDVPAGGCRGVRPPQLPHGQASLPARPAAAGNHLFAVQEAGEGTPDPPVYLERDKERLVGPLLSLPARDQIPLPVPVEERLIVEFMS